MKQFVSRAQARFLKLDGISYPAQSRALHLTLGPQAQTFLTTQAYGNGIYRSGPLFGERRRGRLTAQYAAYSGVHTAHPQGSHVLDLHPYYVLGYSAALRATNPKVDWVGHWLGFPDGLINGQDEIDDRICDALQAGLLDAAHPLLFVSGLANQVSFLAFTLVDMQPEMIPVIPDRIVFPKGERKERR